MDTTNTTATVLVIDDEKQLDGLIELWLRQQGYNCVVAYDGREGLRRFYETQPDLVLLDISLPHLDGWQVCQRLRELSDVPILMLTARGAEQERVHGFDLGADDYITKPFSFPELVARVGAALRRSRSRTAAPVNPALRHIDGPLVIDLAQRRVTYDGKPVHLSRTEYRLLSLVAEHAGELLTHREILAAVWGAAYVDDVDYVRMCVHSLRAKLEPDPSHPVYLLTEYGIGYRLRGPLERLSNSPAASNLAGS